MESNANVEKDYKKWLTFNSSLDDFQRLYDLYIAVDKMRDTGQVTFQSISTDTGIKYYVEQEGVPTALELNGETERRVYLEYMLDHFFPNHDVEEWYSSKIQEQSRGNNHHIEDEASTRRINIDQIEPHRKEKFYYKFKLFFSILFYLGVAAFITLAFVDSLFSGIAVSVGLLIIVANILLARAVAKGILIGIIQGNTVKLSETQYPEIYDIVKDQAQQLGLKEVPEVHIAYGHFNAFVTKFARTKYLLLFSEVVETALKGDHEAIKFIIGHELAHLQRKHLSKGLLLAPSNFVPFLSLAYSRGCEYTCDRIGYHFSHRGALQGMLMLAAGKEVYAKINIEEFINDSVAQSGFWFWLSEKFLSHPHIVKRAKAIKYYNRQQV